MNYLPSFLFGLSVLGLISLFSCIYALVKPFIGWKFNFLASDLQTIVDFPKTGSYAVCIRRDRFRLLKNSENLVRVFPKIIYSIIDLDTQKQIHYRRITFGLQSSYYSKVTCSVGCFKIQTAGKHLFISDENNRFSQDDEIVIRKHLPVYLFVLLIFGICFSGLIFLGGLIVGSLMLGKVIPIY